MTARRKKGSPMKYRGFYCNDELWAEMQAVATECDESDSDFIRKAIQLRIEQINSHGNDGITAEEIINRFISDPDRFNIPQVKPGTMKSQKQPNMVQTFSKEGKK